MATQEIDGIPFNLLIALHKPPELSRLQVRPPGTHMTSAQNQKQHEKDLDLWFERKHQEQLRMPQDYLVYFAPRAIQLLVERFIPRPWIEGYHRSKDPFQYPIKRF